MRAALPVVVFLWAATASAFRGRPVSDLRFDDRSGCEIDAIATDGTSALVLCVERTGEGQVYGQIVRTGGSTDPVFFIARGRASVAASWNGSAYVIALASLDGLSVGTVSRGGAMLSMHTIRDEPFFDVGLASSGARTLLAASLIGDVVGYVLDANAQMIGPAIPLGGILDWDVAPLGSGFAFARFGQTLTTILRFAPDGTIRGSTSIATPIAGAMEQRRHATASNGSRLLLLFASTAERAIKSASVNADGTIERAPATILSTPQPGIEMRSAAIGWTGSDYLATIRLQAGDGRFQPCAMRIAANGDRIGNVDPIAGPDDRPRAIATIGGRTLIGFATAQGSTLDALDGARIQLGRRLDAHEAFAIGTMNGQSLAAWVERHDERASIRASRIDRHGAYLDGPGIILAQSVASDVAVASDGTNWLVVWADGRVRGVRLSREGRLLDATPLDLGDGYEVDVARGANGYLVIVSTRVAWLSLIVDSAGAVSPRLLIAQGTPGDSRGHGRIEFSDVQVAFDGMNFLSVASEVHTACDPIEPVCATTQYLSAARFDRLGAMLEQPLHRFTFVSGPADVAGGNGSFLLLMHQFLKGDFYVTAMMMDGWLPPVATPRIALRVGHSVSAAWDGREFIAAWIGAEWRVQIARITDAGIVDGPRTMIGEDDAVRPQLAADPATTPLLAYLNPQTGTDGVPRVATAFAREVDLLTSIPLAPLISTATRIGSAVRVRWAPVANAFGIDLELLLDGGGYRRIATAPGTSTEIIVPLHVRGDAIRLRAWNSAGASAASADAWIANPRVRSIRK